MRISATGNSRHAGFTLIELLIVIAIIGLATTAVVLSGFGGPPPARTTAETLAARLAMARDLAITSGQDTALTMDAGGYRLEQRDAVGWQPRGRATPWPEGMAVSADIEGHRAETGRLRFDPTGLATPATLHIGPPGPDGARITLGASGEVQLDAR